jgi:hypothetical protein
MQEEHAEANDRPSGDEKSYPETWEITFSVLKEAVAAAEIKNIAEYQGEPLTKRWHVFYQEHPADVVLKMFVQGIFGTIRC